MKIMKTDAFSLENAEVKIFIDAVINSYELKDKETFLNLIRKIGESLFNGNNNYNFNVFNANLYQILKAVPNLCAIFLYGALVKLRFDGNSPAAIILDSDEIDEFIRSLVRHYKNDPEYIKFISENAFFHEHFKTFDEWLHSHFHSIKGNGYHLIEHSEHHLIYKTNYWQTEIYCEEKLTKKMKQIYPGTDFVIVKRETDGQDDLTAYELFYQKGEDHFQLSVVVETVGGELSFTRGASYRGELDNPLMNDFIEAIKELPKYRLIVITQ